MEKKGNVNRSRGAEAAPPEALLVVSSPDAARRYACMALLAYSQTGPEDPRRGGLFFVGGSPHLTPPPSLSPQTSLLYPSPPILSSPSSPLTVK